MKRRSYFILLIAAGVLVTAAVAFRPTARPGWTVPDDSKQLKFSHKTHIEGAGIGCETCHPNAATSKLAGDNLRSVHDNCTSCHEEQLNNQCDFCHKDPENIQVAPPPAARTQLLARDRPGCRTCGSAYLAKRPSPAET